MPAFVIAVDCSSVQAEAEKSGNGYQTLITDDPDLLLLALADIARARGMTEVAKEAGLGRESLYKALSPGAKPRFDTVLKVARALGVRRSAQPI